MIVINAEVLGKEAPQKSSLDDIRTYKVKVLSADAECTCNAPETGSIRKVFMASALGTPEIGDQAYFKINCRGDVSAFNKDAPPHDQNNSAQGCGCNKGPELKI